MPAWLIDLPKLIQIQTIEIVPNFFQIDRVHNDDDIRPVLFQELGGNDFIAEFWDVFVLAVGVDIHHIFNFIPER